MAVRLYEKRRLSELADASQIKFEFAQCEIIIIHIIHLPVSPCRIVKSEPIISVGGVYWGLLLITYYLLLLEILLGMG